MEQINLYFTSTCTNTQTGIDNSQTNDSTNFSTCINDGRGAGEHSKQPL